MFPDLEYISWIRGRPAAALHDLGGSDLRGSRETGVAMPEPVAERPEPPAGVTVETLVATHYGVAPERVLVTAGATHANLLAAAAALAGDREGVAVEAPGYEPMVETPRGLGATVSRFDRPRTADYALEPDRVAAALDGDTALVSVTNRHNPSGRLTARETLRGVAETAADAGAHLLVDEVYAPYDTAGAESAGDRGRVFGGVSAVDLPDTVVTGSLTKFWGLGDLRLGWLVADEAFVERARRVKHHVPAVAGTSRAMARRVLHDPEGVVERSRALAADHADLLSAFVADRPALSGPVFEGSSYGFLAHDRVDGTTLARAAGDRGVLVVPGRFFGDEDRVRVSLGRSREDAAAALTAFGEVLETDV